ncbi:hypothetical protein P044_03035, partial [Brucella suis 97-9757]
MTLSQVVITLQVFVQVCSSCAA